MPGKAGSVARGALGENRAPKAPARNTQVSLCGWQARNWLIAESSYYPTRIPSITYDQIGVYRALNDRMGNRRTPERSRDNRPA